MAGRARLSSTAGEQADSQRVDQWLWYARFAKSRTLAHALVMRGKVRINRQRIDKPSQALKIGDVVTLSVGPRVRIITVLGIGQRRGPATEAAGLFEELTPAADQTTSSASASGREGQGPGGPNAAPAPRLQGAGRPTKRDRRLTERLRGRFDDL